MTREALCIGSTTGEAYAIVNTHVYKAAFISLGLPSDFTLISLSQAGAPAVCSLGRRCVWGQPIALPARRIHGAHQASTAAVSPSSAR